MKITNIDDTSITIVCSVDLEKYISKQQIENMIIDYIFNLEWRKQISLLGFNNVSIANSKEFIIINNKTYRIEDYISVELPPMCDNIIINQNNISRNEIYVNRRKRKT